MSGINFKKERYIVTEVHTLDYISGTVYLTDARSEKQAIINCLEYSGDIYPDDDDSTEVKYEDWLKRMNNMSLNDLEQHDRENGNVWHAELFKVPELTEEQPVVRIAMLDTD